MALRLGGRLGVLRADELARDLGTRRGNTAQPITRAARTDLPRVSRQGLVVCLGGERETVRTLDRQRRAGAPAGTFVAYSLGTIGAACAQRAVCAIHVAVFARTSGVARRGILRRFFAGRGSSVAQASC